MDRPKPNEIPSESINREIFYLWDCCEQYLSKTSKGQLLAPSQFNPFKTGCILFIGLNPSDGKRALKEINSNLNEEDLKWKGIKFTDVGKLLEFDKQVREKYNRYFGKIKQIAADCHIEWDHIDLFFYRTTSSKEFREIIGFNDKTKELSHDAWEFQFSIAQEIISIVNPRVIIVNGALASRILKAEDEAVSKEINKNIGTYTYTLGNRRVPIFFSSMLSGQRALDNESFERLKWQIKRSIELNEGND